jgi:hypothetical protein
MELLNRMHTDEQDAPLMPEWSIDGAGIEETLEWDCGGDELVQEYIEWSGNEWRNALDDLLLAVGDGQNRVGDAYDEVMLFRRVSSRGRELGAYAGWPVKVFYDNEDYAGSWLEPIRYPTELSKGMLKEITEGTNPAWVVQVGTHH